MQRAPIRAAILERIDEVETVAASAFVLEPDGHEVGFAPLVVVIQVQQERHDTLTLASNLIGVIRYQRIDEIEMLRALLAGVVVQHRQRLELPEGNSDVGADVHLREHADEIGGDASRIAVGGDSAGGYLATAVCLDAKRLGLPQPVHQLLVYPDIDGANRSESMVTIDAFVNLPMIASMHAAHAGDDLTNPRASPIHADDHSGLAPATIFAASHDPFVDQGRAYAAVLRASGVPVAYSCYDGTIHAFFTMGGAVDVAKQAVADAASALATAFAG